MAKIAGAALRILETSLYAITFGCAAIILGFYSYFLAILSDHKQPIYNWVRAVEGISGIAVVYLIFAVVLTCCLGGVRFFAFLAIVLDIVFAAAFIAVAVMTRDGASSCQGDVKTPIGNGPADSKSGYGSDGFGTKGDENVTYSVSLGTACKYNTACFAVALIAVFFFIFSAVIQLWLGRHHQREKRYGPSPKNNYTKGSGGRFGNMFSRRRRARTTRERDAEMAAAGGLAAPHNGHTMRPSHDTGYTGSTVGNAAAHDHHHNKTGAGGYHTHPTGTGVNPYGYDNSANTATNY